MVSVMQHPFNTGMSYPAIHNTPYFVSHYHPAPLGVSPHCSFNSVTNFMS
jgi:hypothetical protein